MWSLRVSILSLIAVWLGAADSQAQSAEPSGMRNVEIELVVPAGTPLRIALQERVRIKRPDKPVRAILTSAVYAFDRAVIPAGTEVHGKITRVDPIPRKERILAAANGNLTPALSYGIAFDSLVLPDGTGIQIHARVSPGSTGVLRLVSGAEREKKKNAATRAAAGVKKEVSDTVSGLSVSIKSPGRLGRVKQYLASQLPFRRQHLEQGSRFNATLEEPLDFGATTRADEDLAA